MTNSNTLAALVTLISLAITTAPALGEGSAQTYSEEEQRAAYAFCARAFVKPLHVHKLKKQDGRLFVLGSDGSGVTVSEAKALNRCAAETLRGEREME